MHKSEIEVMNVLCKEWFRELSAYEIAKKANITAPTVYKVMGKLKKRNFLTKTNSKIKINLNNIFSYRFKLLKDADQLYELDNKILSKIIEVYNILSNIYRYEMLSFIVIGSAATNELTETSDIDILILVKKKKEFDFRKKGLLRLGNIHIIEKTQEEAEDDYLRGDDFILSALMNGLVLKDESLFKQFLIKPLPQPSQQLITVKKERLLRLERRLTNYLKDGDYKALASEFKNYLIEKGRLILLEKGVLPSSKKDIIIRIKKIDKKIYKQYTSVNEKNVRGMVVENVGKS